MWVQEMLNVEEIVIPSEKKQEILNELTQTL